MSGKTLDKWTVVELKAELKVRGLATTGLKAELVARLSDAIAADSQPPEAIAIQTDVARSDTPAAMQEEPQAATTTQEHPIAENKTPKQSDHPLEAVLPPPIEPPPSHDQLPSTAHEPQATANVQSKAPTLKPPSAPVPAAPVDPDLMPSDQDLLYEEELLRNPYNLKMWTRYIMAKTEAPPKRRYLLYERALRSLPGSYKLWYAYLTERLKAVRGVRFDSPAMKSLNNTYERALVSMHKMPRVWLDYLDLLVEQKHITLARRTFDRALAALPITQHDRIWTLYLVRLTTALIESTSPHLPKMMLV